MPTDDTRGAPTGGAPNTQLLDFNAPTGPAVQYDAQGYPIPTADQIKGASYSLTFGTGAKAGQVAYDPAMQPPQPESDNPFQPGSANWNAWRSHNTKLAQNEANKKAWQQQHESVRAQPVAAAAPAQAAPAQPFASSGIDLTKDGKGESFTDSIIKHFSEQGIPEASNEAKTTLDSFRASQPQDMSPYYDYASKLTSAKIDNAMSARGSYGSSNATGQIGAAEMALRADEAKANAQYGLDRYASEGNLAGSADASDARANALKYEWTKGLSDMAFKSQDAGESRGSQLFEHNLALANAKAGNYTASTDKAITGVGEATDAANNVAMGNAADQVSGANADANAAASHTASVMDSANKLGTNYFNYQAGEDAKEAANKPKAN